MAMARMASGPGGATRACVRCGLYLISEGQARLALLFGEANPHTGRDQATIEVLCADSNRAAAVLSDSNGLEVPLNITGDVHHPQVQVDILRALGMR